MDPHVFEYAEFILVVTTIQFRGLNANRANCERVVNSMLKMWNRGFTCDGKPVRFTINWEIGGKEKPYYDQVYMVPGGGDRYKRSWVRGEFMYPMPNYWKGRLHDRYLRPNQQHTCVLYSGDPDYDWMVAHEYGHLLGLHDRYQDRIVNGQTVSIPNPGWEGNKCLCIIFSIPPRPTASSLQPPPHAAKPHPHNNDAASNHPSHDATPSPSSSNEDYNTVHNAHATHTPTNAPNTHESPANDETTRYPNTPPSAHPNALPPALTHPNTAPQPPSDTNPTPPQTLSDAPRPLVSPNDLSHSHDPHAHPPRGTPRTVPTAVQLYAKGNHNPKPLSSKNTTRHAPATTPFLPAPTRRRTLPPQTPLGRRLAHSGCAWKHTPSASSGGSAWRDALALASGSLRLLGVAWRFRCGLQRARLSGTP
jgi:hypothetical protein